jgi:anaerobic selenocysteine-containing dehydrogenase
VHSRRRLRRDPDAQPAIPLEALQSLILRSTGNGSFRKLLAEPHGRELPPHTPGTYLGRKLASEEGEIDVAPAALLEQTRGLEALFEHEVASQDQLRLITRRHVKTHNSWTHNDPHFVAGPRHTNHLYMHPDDAERAGLAHGDLADVRSATGAVRVPVQLLADLQPGTVALPHGWGHQHAKGLSVASKTAGVNVNLLAADGPGAVEHTSGMAHLTGIPVEVEPARGPQDASSWSGLPEAPAPRDR